MKKLKMNSTLNHKHDHYSPYEVITLYGKSFEKLKNNPSAKNLYIAEYCDLMCIDSNDWSLQTEEEFFCQEIRQEPEINMTM